MAKQINRRKKYFIHEIQRKYIFISLVPLIISAFLIILFLFVPLDIVVFYTGPAAEKQAAVAQLRTLGIRVWPAIFLAMLVSGLLSVYITHKFAGPMYRFEQTVKEIAEGDLSVRIRLRKGDDFTQLESLLNKAFGRVDAMVSEIKEEHTQLRTKLEALRTDIKERNPSLDEISGQMESLLEGHKRLSQRLGQFRLSGQV